MYLIFIFLSVHEGGWSSIEVMLSHSTPPSPTYMYTVYKSRDNEWLQLLHNPLGLGMSTLFLSKLTKCLMTFLRFVQEDHCKFIPISK